MKKLITIIAAVTAAFSAFAMNDDGHKLTALWEKYEAANKADKPKTEAEILSQIKKEAIEKRYSVDFYDAATKYVDAVRRRNWKDREPAKKALEEEIKAYNDPIITFVWMDQFCYEGYQRLKEFADGQAFEGRNEPLYRGVGGFLAGVLPHFIENDAEYVLWRLVAKGDKESIEKLQKLIGTRYPAAPALEYWQAGSIADKEQRIKAITDLAAKYEGTAAGLLPKADVLRYRLQNTEESNPATDAPYKELYAECKEAEKARNAFKGEEKIIANEIKSFLNLIYNLEMKTLGIYFDKGKLVVLFRNMASAKVNLYQDGARKAYKTWEVKNPAGSFYKQDTVKIDLPKLSDGDYQAEVINGKVQSSNSYEQYTLSIANRKDSKGLNVYVADHISGKPLTKATIYLKKGSSVVASAAISLSGFTPLPASITKHISTKSSYTLYAVSGTRKSKTVWVPTGEDYYGDSSKDVQCNIYRDRGAYNPGDEMQFKAILYSGDPMVKYQALEGRKVTAILNDSEGNELQKLSLKTNAYGSVSGKFTLPKGLRNGWFSINIKDGKNYVGGDSFRVDEFVLPTFEIALDKHERLFLEGDDVPVEGSVTSYSGHKLSGARAILTVKKYGDLVYEAEQEIGTDNRFSFIVPKVQQGFHNATVKVVDATGETIEKSTWFYIGTELSVDMTVVNAAPGEFTLKNEQSGGGWRWRPRIQRAIVTEDDIVLKLQAKDDNGNPVPLPVRYELADIREGTVASGESVSLKGVPSGVYTLKTSVEERGAKGSAEMKILVLRPQDKEIPADVKAVFLPGAETVDGAVKARFGCGEGTAYAQIALFGDRKEVLVTKSVTAKGMADLTLDYKKAYPDAVRLQVYWFIEGHAWEYGRQYRRAKSRLELPLKFTRFTSDAYPGTEYTFTLKTAAGVEALAAVWDKSIDAVARNWWPSVTLSDYSVPSVSVNAACGRVSGGGIAMDDDAVFDEVQVVGYGKPARFSLRSKSASANMVMADALMVEEEMVAESASDAGGASEDADVAIRSEFANSLCFQPHLLSAKDGTLSFSFKTSDKLSTYYVRVYAHNAAMQNAMEEKEMVVSLPVKVSLLEPRYLYEGDTYVAAVTVSSIASQPVSGVVKLAVPGGLIQSSGPVTIPAGETVTFRFPVETPSFAGTSPSSSGTSPSSSGLSRGSLTLTASFVAPDFSDAVRVTIPVYPARQTLTEAHSAVLLAGMSRDKLLADLRSRFVNVSASEATLKEITVLDMVRDAIPSHVEPSGKDVLSLSEAWYTRCVAASFAGDPSSFAGDPSSFAGLTGESVDGDLLKQILSCRNSDGGYAWFEGMNSSPIITAVLLERFALLKARGVEVPEASASVKYLDKVMFGTQKPLWYGWLSDAQYMHVRALYAGVPFEVKPVTKADKQRLSDFKKYAKSYLTPSKADGRGLQGAILAKARRLLTLRALASSSQGIALAKAWGVGLSAGTKLQKSIKADVASLLEYAVEHRDGGWYYPNAVMPWRGLLESEAYAHALLCRLLSSDSVAVADGIRLWLMLQKETQKWDAEPAFVDAIDAILSGSADVLNTKVLALSATYEAPFDAIKAAGNGFTVSRQFFLNGVEIAPGAELSVGDKITVKYQIWNAENRSFVKLDAGREASLQPVRQLSGLSGWTLYRNVKAERTEYFWEVCPEENLVLEEEFYVTRAGRFRAPVLVIESLYAPHYRANSAYLSPLEVK